MKPLSPILLASDIKRLIKTHDQALFWLMIEYYRAALSKKQDGCINVGNYKLFYHDLDRALFMIRESMFIKYYDVPLTNNSPMIIDVGSNIGVTMLNFKNRYPNARLYCFEPQKNAFILLNKNMAQNRLTNTFVFNMAVTDHAGHVSFVEDHDGTGLLGHMGQSDHKVQCCKLSDIITEPVDLLKLDIEGAEAQVFKDLTDTGKLRMIKKIVMEYHYSAMPKGRLEEIARQAGYDLTIDSYGLCECRAVMSISG